MVIAPSDAAPAQTRGRRGVAASGSAGKRATRRSRGTSKPRKSSSSRGASPFASSEKQVRKWVQVHRPPGNSENVKFTIQQWVAVQDLTEEERVKYNLVSGVDSRSSNQQLTETPNAAVAAIEQSSLKKKAAPKPPPRPSSVTFASDTVASSAKDTVVSPSADAAAAAPAEISAATTAAAASQANQSDKTISDAAHSAVAALPPCDAAAAAVAPAPMPPQDQQETVEREAPKTEQKRAAPSEALLKELEPPVKRQRTEGPSSLEADKSSPEATAVTTSTMATDVLMPDA